MRFGWFSIWFSTKQCVTIVGQGCGFVEILPLAKATVCMYEHICTCANFVVASKLQSTIDIQAVLCYNKTMKCDLHMHSNCSDGVFPPEKLVQMAKERGVRCMSLTDHDTTCGVLRAVTEGQKLGIQVIPGIELSTFSTMEVHILGFNVNYQDEAFQQELAHVANLRVERNKLLVQKLKEHGFDIDLSKIKTTGTIGRGDIGREMVRLGYCKDSAEVFDKYLGAGKCCYVQSQRLTPVEAIQLTLRHGGIPVLAHPKNLHISFKEFEKFLRPLALAGLGGIEAQFLHTIQPSETSTQKWQKSTNLLSQGEAIFTTMPTAWTSVAKTSSPTATPEQFWEYDTKNYTINYCCAHSFCGRFCLSNGASNAKPVGRVCKNQLQRGFFVLPTVAKFAKRCQCKLAWVLLKCQAKKANCQRLACFGATKRCRLQLRVAKFQQHFATFCLRGKTKARCNGVF